MYNREIIGQLVDFISSKDGRTDKSRLQNEVQEAFGLVKDRSVYYCDWFAIRFCKAASRSFGNTVLALSALHRYDGIPFTDCVWLTYDEANQKLKWDSNRTALYELNCRLKKANEKEA